MLYWASLSEEMYITVSRILKHNFTQQPDEVNSLASAECLLQLSKTPSRITELPKHFLLLLDISLFKNQPSKLCVERGFWAPALSIKNILKQVWSHARSDMWLQIQFLNCCWGEQGTAELVSKSKVWMALPAAVGWLSSWPHCSAHCCKDSPAQAAGTATLPAALQLPPGAVPINTGSSCLVQGHAACVLRGMLCVTSAPNLQRQGAKDQCFRLKLMTAANNPLFIKLILFCWY